MRILAIGAHLDDIELACGGTLSRAIEQGHTVKMVVLSKSGYTNYDGKQMRTDDTAEMEGKNAARILGVEDLDIFSFETKCVPYHYTVIETLDRVISEYDPDIIFTHHVFDTHQSHEGTAKSTFSAARRKNTVFMYEPIVPSGRSYVPFHPQLYVDFTEKQLNIKISALKAHETEYKKFGNGWIDGVIARARFRGYEMGKEYAEAFEVVRCTLEDISWMKK